MSRLEYVEFDQIDPDEFVCLLNKQKIRKHLIAHDLFDAESVRGWINQKKQIDCMQGCKIRAIRLNGQLLGWCGIQLENRQYGIAVVIDDKFWGIGREVFQEIIKWAGEMGHSELFIHLHHTRPVYKFLRKISSKVYQSEILGDRFTTYQLVLK